MQKNFFLIPGFKQKTSDPQYSWLAKFLSTNGFNVIKTSIEWNQKLISDYTKDFKKFYKENKSGASYLLGFSYGAVVALLSANELKPKKIYLCSLSPDFKEDLVEMKPWIKKLIGKRRIADIKTRSAKQIAKTLTVPSVVFYGEAEGKLYPSLKIRCQETAKLAKNSKLIVVKNAPHKLNHPEYKKSLKQELRLLNSHNTSTAQHLPTKIKTV